MQIKTPSAVLQLAVVFTLLLAVAAVYMVLSPPWLGLVLSQDTEQESVLVRSSLAALPPGGRAPWFLTGIGSSANGNIIALLPEDLAEDTDLIGSNAGIVQFLQRQSSLFAALHAPVVELALRDADGTNFVVQVTPQQRPLGSLPLSFWVQVLVACACFLTGIWIWSLRQADWGPRWFLASGAGIMLSAMSAAVYSSRELALDNTLFKLLSAINFAGAALFGAAMVGLFLSYPRRLLSLKWILGLPVLLWSAALVQIMQRYALLPYLYPDIYMPPQLILTEMTGIILCTTAQWFATRGDPLARAALRWLGMSIVVCSGLFIVLFYIPVIMGLPLVVSQGYSFIFFLLIYLGIALGLRRYRLFDLGTWAFRIIFYLSALIGFLLLDGLILSLVEVNINISTGLSLVLIGFGYLPLRDWLWRLTLGRNRAVDENRFMEVMDIPFTTEPQLANRKWQQLLRELFDPLELLEHPDTGGAASLLQDGVQLQLPATASVNAVTLKFSHGGQRLFSSEDLRFASQLVKLLQHAETSRDSYEQGRLQERKRIAQDLHDDIGARLISSLHSEDLGHTRSNIRKTITDLRAVVAGLVGTRMQLSVLVSNLRFETSTRLEEAGMELEWPFDEQGDSDLPVDYRFNRNVSSIVRECINNVITHARASKVWIWTAHTPQTFSLVIADNGIGLRTGSSNGNGLTNINERTRSLGGKVVMGSNSGGLRLQFEFPLQPGSET